MPEGDSLHRAARGLQVLVGTEVEAEAPHPRGAAVARLVDGRRLVSARAVGKNLLLAFEGGVVVRSHLRMRGRWTVVPRGRERTGRPWLVLRGNEHEAVLWNGPVLELERGRTARLGPDILTERVDAGRLRGADQRRALGDVLLDQRLVAGIGNLWRAEALWHARISPWRAVENASDEELQSVLDQAARLMGSSLEGGRRRRAVYRRAGRPCPRCGTPISSRGQGDDNRIAYWCPGCQS
ncbi:MAG: DNA glycosylase [Actinobacteria bacterium]|nr:DNA glycosylase [Actinomycetota bacterium]